MSDGGLESEFILTFELEINDASGVEGIFLLLLWNASQNIHPLQSGNPASFANLKYSEKRNPHDVVAWPLCPQIQGSAYWNIRNRNVQSQSKSM